MLEERDVNEVLIITHLLKLDGISPMLTSLHGIRHVSHTAAASHSIVYLAQDILCRNEFDVDIQVT